jgi:Domain of unknown function (DUF4149)
MSFLRYLMLVSLVVWVGGLIFFPVVAQTAFATLPNRHLAGEVVGKSLSALHWMGLVSGAVFLVCSWLSNRFSAGTADLASASHLLIVLMLALTLISQFAIIPRMDAIRASLPAEIDSVPPSDLARVRFDALHQWSTRVESGVLLLGFVVVYLFSKPSS